MSEKALQNEFREWLERGPGEAMYGGIIKAAAISEQHRLKRKLETGNLFQHIEHEDRVALERAGQALQQGQRMADRGRKRNVIIKELAASPPPQPEAER